MRSGIEPVSRLVWIFAGPILWFGHFAAMYGAEALICTGAQGHESFRGVATGLTLIAIAALAGFIVWIARSGSANLALDTSRGYVPFLRDVSIMLAILAVVGVIWTAMGGTTLPACAGPPAAMQNAPAG